MHPDMAEFYRKQDAERAKAADALAYGMANARIGQGNTVRCEGPTPYEVDNMRPYALLAVIAQEPPPALAKPASSPAGIAALRRVRHVRRGSEYEVLGEAEGQVSVKGAVILEEGDRVVVYRGADGRLWWRVPEEFEDGRFVTLHPPQDQA